LQKELLHRFIVTGTPCLSLPKPVSYSIKKLLEELMNNPTPESENEFILGACEHLLEDMLRHFTTHSGTAEASLNRMMCFIEVIMDPSF
jgi:hypothetical protein